MPDIIITPSTGKLEFVDNSAQNIRKHAFTLDDDDGIKIDAPFRASSVRAPLNIINVNVDNSNTNYPFVLASGSAETGIKTLMMDGSGGTYNPFTNTATIDISGNSATTTLASNSTQLNGQAASYYTDVNARLGYTPVNKAGDTVTGNLIINGNFTVNGATTLFSASNVYISSSQLYIEDNILTLNAFSPYLRYAGVEMYDSGSGTLSSLLWDGEADYFFLSGSSVNGKIITGPDGQTNLTANYVPKATAGYKLGNSLIYDNGTNVGIGTTSPVSKLHIEQIQNAESLITLKNDRQDLGDVAIFGISAQNGVTAVSKISFYRGGGGSSGYLTFSTKVDNASSLTEKVRIDGAGNVGIGTTGPGTKLEVSGSIRGGSFPVLVTNTGEAWFGRGGDRTLGTYTLQLGGSSATGTKFEIVDRAWTKVIASISGEAPLDSFVINSAGNVGIGTSSPSYKLEVYSGAKTSAFTGLSISNFNNYDGTAASLVTSQLRFAILENDTGTYNAPARTFAILESGNEVNNSSSDGFFAISTRFNAVVAQKFRITAAGNVGIGTTVPTALLELSSSTAASLLNVKGAGGNGILFVSGSGAVGIGTTSLTDGARLTILGETRIASSAAYTTHLNYLNGGNNIISSANGGSTVFRGSSNNITAMTILGTGNVDINRLTIDGGNYAFNYFQSLSDFVSGSLVTTDIPASATNGLSFVMNVVGKSYNTTTSPFNFSVQGYLYNNQIINYSGLRLDSSGLTTIKIFENGGFLCFWWARVSYWNAFEVSVRSYDAAKTNYNRVTNITDVAEPTGSKKVTVTLQTLLRADVSATNTVDLRAPRFYDSENITYYVDPASTSNLVGLTVTNTITGNAATATTASYSLNTALTTAATYPITSSWATNAVTALNGGVTSISAGTGIGTSASTGAVTITNSSPNATHTGDVTGATALTIANDAVTTVKILNANVTNAKLANSSVTIGSTAVALGDTVTTFAGLASVTSTAFVGALTGNVTGNVTGTAGSETFGTVTGRGASTTTQISVGTTSAGSMYTGIKSGAGYSDAVSGATFKSITDHPTGGSYAFAAYFNGAPGTGTNSFFVAADGTGYFKGNVGIGTTAPQYPLDISGSNIRSFSTAGGAEPGFIADYPSSNGYGGFFIHVNNTRRWRIGSVGDTNVQPALNFWQEGTGSRMIITNTGNVGIGTTSPTTKLAVSDGTTIAQVNPSSGVAYFGTVNNYPMALSVNSSEKVRILNDGNVGIGTTSPGAPLTIYKASNPWMRINGGGAFSYIQLDDGTSYGYLFKNTSSDTTNGALAGAMYTYTDSGKAFQHIHSGTPLFTILSGGSVGIGTTSPANKLHVEGGNAVPLYVKGGTSAWVIFERNTKQLYLNANYSDTNLYAQISPRSSDNMALSLSSREVAGDLLVSTTGKVGIGTVSPSNAKVHIVGDGSYVGDYGYNTLRLEDASGYPGLNYRNGNANWLLRMNGGDTGFDIAYSSNASAPGTGTYSQLVKIKNDGNVGIGTTSPIAKLEAYGGSMDPTLTPGDPSIFSVNSLGVQLAVGRMVTSPFSVWLQGKHATVGGGLTYPIVLNPLGGFVGIGTTSPGTLLQVHGSNPFFRISNSASSDQGIKITYGNSDTHGLHLLYNASSALSYIDNTYPIDAAQVWGDILFRQNVASTMTTRMIIKANSGNVGIGTTSPATKLEVYGVVRVSESSSGGILQLTAGASAIDIASTFYGGSRRPITFTMDGEKVRIDTVGNVGIGTTTGTFTLNVYNNADVWHARFGSATGEVRIGGQTSSGAVIQSFVPGSGTVRDLYLQRDGGNIGVGLNNPSVKVHIYENANRVTYITQNNNHTARFEAYGTATAIDTTASNGIFFRMNGSDVVKFAADGNVGIGSTSPGYKLDVVGDINFSSTLKLGGVDVISNSSSDVYINGRVIRNASTSTQDGMYIGYNSGGTTNAHIRFYANAGNERMRIQANDGNVGIGTTSAGKKLDVEGVVRTRGASGTGGFEIGAATTGTAKWRIEWDSASDSLDFNWVG